MSSIEIAIVDYQMGNLRSVQKALEHVGADATITDDPNKIAEARKVILPGVGAFGDAMRELQARNLPAPIIESIQAGKPFLGICLGLQLLFETGFEGERHRGLGVLAGEVVRFPNSPDRKVHIWAGIKCESKNQTANCSMTFLRRLTFTSCILIMSILRIHRTFGYHATTDSNSAHPFGATICLRLNFILKRVSAMA